MERLRERRFLACLALVVVGLLAWIYIRTSPPEVVVEFGSGAIVVSEQRQVVQIPLIASVSPRTRVIVTLQVSGTATEGQDFAFPRRRVTIPAGSTQAEVPLRVMMDRERGESDEIVEVSIERVEGGTIGANRVFILTIEGDSPSPTTPPLGSVPGFPTPTTSIPGSGSAPATTAAPATAESPPGTSSRPGTSSPAQSSIDVGSLTEGADQDVASIRVDGGISDADSVLLVLVANTINTGTAPVPVLDGALNWELVATVTRNEGPRRLTMFRTVAAHNAPIELSIDFPERQGVVDWIILQLRGVALDQNGSGAIVQSATGAAVDFEFVGSVQLAPLSGSGHVTVGGFFAGAEALAPGPGFELEAVVGPQKRLLLAISGSDSFVTTAQWDNRAHWLGIGVEVANAG